ncbi:MAG: flagellar motor protein [Acidobacteriota bacterium]
MAGRKPELASIIGIIAGPGFLLIGNILEGGHTSSLIQITAAIIVFGGTLGCVMISAPLNVFIASLKGIIDGFLAPHHDSAALAEVIVDIAKRARKDGLVSLEGEVANLEDEFLRDALMLALDGMDSQAMRNQLETTIGREEHEAEAIAKVFESAGAFCPTMGIIGAVMGLIHVMSNLSDVAKVGAGIAVAFVATIYGVGAANIVFLPINKKIALQIHHHTQFREMAMEGAIAIQEGMNPREVEALLRAYTGVAAEGK